MSGILIGLSDLSPALQSLHGFVTGFVDLILCDLALNGLGLGLGFKAYLGFVWGGSYKQVKHQVHEFKCCGVDN